MFGNSQIVPLCEQCQLCNVHFSTSGKKQTEERVRLTTRIRPTLINNSSFINMERDEVIQHITHFQVDYYKTWHTTNSAVNYRNTDKKSNLNNPIKTWTLKEVKTYHRMLLHWIASDVLVFSQSLEDSVRLETKIAAFVTFSAGTAHFHTALCQTNKTIWNICSKLHQEPLKKWHFKPLKTT